MRNIFKYLMIFMLINVLSGCSVIDSSEIKLDEKNQDLLSAIGPISSNFSFAKLEKGEIAFLTAKPNEVVFLDEKQKTQKSVELPENRQCLEITAGKDYFYVYCSDEDESAGFLRIYAQNTKLIKEISLPFQRVSVSNEMVYGYYDGTDDFFSWDSNISNSHIEANYYISEEKLLKNFSGKITDWNEIRGEEKVSIGKLQLYHCSSDDYHGTDYYSDKKPLSVLKQIDYVRYCEGKLVSEEDDTNINLRLNQIYSMMRKEEDNFLIYGFEINDKIYGICNVYRQRGELLDFCTKDLDYSFSFSYTEKEDELYKVNEYNDIELIYEDKYNCLYHKPDGVYYTKLGSEEKEKIYDYHGEIGITLLEGYVKFREIEILYYDDDYIDKQEIIKVW